MPTLKLPSIYPITDCRISGLSHLQQVRRMVEGGATFIQLREKSLGSGAFLDDAAAAVEFARARGVQIIINDRVDVALAAGADGVHLGQTDIPPAAARLLMGSEAIIGYSTHSAAQAAEAAAMPVDYIAIGPVFATSTKENPDDVVGLEGLAAVRAAIGTIPLVAIGGIDGQRLRSVSDAGGDCAAVISSVLIPPDRIAASVANLLAVSKS